MKFLALIALIALIAIPTSIADIQCAVKDSRLGESCNAPDIVVFRLSDTKNAHAAVWNANAAANPVMVCCGNMQNPKHTGTAIFWLGSDTNSHGWASAAGLTSPTPIEIGSDNLLGCTVAADSCPSAYELLISMNATLDANNNPYNAHLGDVASYPYKICCRETGTACINPGDKNKKCTLDSDCCNYVPSGQNYCSKVSPDGNLPANEWHCCPKGYYWDVVGQLCIESEACYLPDLTQPCQFAPPNNPANCPPWNPCPSPQADWWTAPDCLKMPTTACCYVLKYAVDPFWDLTDPLGKSNIKVFNRTGGQS